MPKPTLLDRLVGTWQTEARHPALPDVVVGGEATIEWLEGERFLIMRARLEHPDFPDSVSIIGVTDKDRAEALPNVEPASDEQLTMHYFDSRGVFRVFLVSVDDGVWCISRAATGFSQRFAGILADDGGSIQGQWQLSEDGVHWQDDLKIDYRRQV